MAQPKPPGFFKPIWVNRSSQTLEIPPAYVKHIKLKTPKNVKLKGPCGDTWPVKLVRKDDKLYFEQGWYEFMKCHSLQDMDFCFFKYNGKTDFKVKIFDGKSGIKRVAFDTNSTSKGLNESSDPKGSETSEHRGAESRSEDLVRPSFVESMKHYNISKSYVLRVPASFINEHFPNNGRKLKIVLENKEGKEWPVTLILYTCVISGGWCAFVRDNHIEVGDTCTFELVHQLKLRVHISRQSDSSQSSKRQPSQQEPEGLGNKKKRRVSEGAQKVAQAPSQHHPKQKGKEQSVADSDANEDEMAKKAPAATEQGQADVEELREQHKQTKRELAELKEENRRIMQMLKNLGTSSSP